MATYEEKQKLKEWEEYRRDIECATPVEVNMTEAEKTKKKMYLEAHPVEWIQYFFPMYAKYPFAKFQIKAIKRILEHDEWFEVLSWSRESAKSTIVMFCVMYLALTGRKKNVILASATETSAEKLLRPYKANFESKQPMQLTYIFHSGFALETDRCILVFDYWMDPAGVMPRLLQSPKPLYVFSSHFHEDHFNRDIFFWRTRKANVRYILSKDILKHRRAQKEEADAWLGKGATWEDELLRATATGSNDSGVSWVIETDGKRIFHAGDLNNWYARFLTDDYHGGLVYSPDFGIDIDPAKEEKRFLGELKDIRKLTDRFDVVMFPVDGRIGNGYTRGARQFLDVFRTGLFVPMHFVASGFESAWRMKEFTDAKSVPFWCIRREGECCEVKEIIAQASR